MTLLESGKANDWSLQQLGFTKNWLQQPTNQEETETPKSELEQVQADIAAAQEAQQVAQGRQYLSYNANRGTTNFDLSIPTYDFNKALQNYLSNVLSDTQLHQAAAFNPNFNPSKAKAEQAEKYIAQQQQNLNNYFTNFATSWRPNYESGQSNRDTMQNYLSRLFATYNKGTNTDGTPITDYVYDWNKYFTQIGDNQFLINGSLDKTTGRYAYYIPGQGIKESNILDTSNPYIAQQLGYTIPSQKEGGKVEFLQSGGGFDYDAWAASQEKPKAQVTSKPQQTSTHKQENSPREMTAADIAAISADIGSIAASFVPGYGTAASAVLGIGSTLSNFISDVNDSNTSLGDALWNGAKGLGADAIGLVPGFGAGAKGWKIATRLAKYGTSILAGLNTLDLAQNSPEIMNSFKKVLSLKVSDMNLQDWRNIQNGLSMLATAGRLGHGVAVHKGYKGQLKVTNPKPTDTSVPKTHIEKAKAKLNSLKSKESTYDYGGQNDLPWYHDANIYLWGANQKGLNFGLKNPYKVNMQDHMKAYGPTKVRTSIDQQLPFSPKKSIGESTPKQEKLNIKNPIYADRNMKSVNKGTKKAVYMKQIGGILYALRNGGILKADNGAKMTGINFVNGSSWYDNIFSHYKQNILDTLKSDNSKQYYAWLNDMQDAHHEIRDMAGGDSQSWIQTAYKSDAVKQYQTNYGNNRWGQNFNELGISKANNESSQGGLPQRYDLGDNKRITTDNSKNNWAPDGLYSAITDDRRLLGKKGDYTPQQLENFQNELKNVGYNLIEGNGGYYKLEPILASTPKPEQPTGDKEKEKNAADSATERKTIPVPEYKNPFDPSLLISAAKYFTGLRGNRDIYQNLLDEMPEAPLRDPLDRKLAIVGWQERIKSGQNQLADLRRIQQIQQGSDQQTNFATALDTERTGRDIMDRAFAEDSGRQFETAQKSWNLDNEDTLYNTGVGDANRKSIADRQRMMAQIRAAWRSGDQNLKMGLLADTGNWFMKRYQREQDLVDKAKELSLGTPEEWAQSEYTSRLGELANKKASDLTEADRAKIEAIRAQIMREMRQNYSKRYYDLYHTPGFGGGFGQTLMSKNGSKLEVAKLKARSKDNDRYVSMIKDLRKRRRR